MRCGKKDGVSEPGEAGIREQARSRGKPEKLHRVSIEVRRKRAAILREWAHDA